MANGSEPGSTPDDALGQEFIHYVGNASPILTACCERSSRAEWVAENADCRLEKHALSAWRRTLQLSSVSQVKASINSVISLRYFRPTSLDAALRLIAEASAVTVAGGTALNISKVDRHSGKRIVDLGNLHDSRRIFRGEQHWRISTMTTWSDLLEASDLPSHFEGLKEAARQIGSLQIQNMGTICGNLCRASAVSDGIPNLLTMNALVELRTVIGFRHLSVNDFLVGDNATVLGADELVVGVIIPDPIRPARSGFVKISARKQFSVSILNVAAALEMNADLTIGAARIAVGGFTPSAVRLRRLEDCLLGCQIGDQVQAVMDDMYLGGLDLADDRRAAAAYRRDTLQSVLGRLVVGLCQ
ncbi:MAG: FAD binding domain-containing protein [Janthinobacterium lividum]